MKEVVETMKTCRWVWVCSFLCIIFSGCYSDEEIKSGDNEPKIVALVEVDTPRGLIEGLLGLTAKTQPSLSWMEPKVLSGMAFELIKSNFPVLEHLNLDLPYWFGILKGEKAGGCFFGVIPVNNGLGGGKALMDFLFEEKAVKAGDKVHVTKDKKKIWWRVADGYLLTSSKREFLELLEGSVLQKLKARNEGSPEKMITAEIWPARAADAWGLEVEEIFSMIAVFWRLSFLSARIRVEDNLLSHLELMLRGVLDRKLSRYAKLAGDIEVLGFQITVDEEKFLLEGMVNPFLGSSLDMTITGSRAGSPVGIDYFKESPFFVFSHRTSWSSRENQKRCFLEDIEGFLNSSLVDNEKEDDIRTSAERFLGAWFGDVTVGVHGVSADSKGKAKSMLGVTGVFEVIDAEELRAAAIQLFNVLRSVKSLRNNNSFHGCFRVDTRNRTKGGFLIDWVSFDYDGVRCSGPLSLLLTWFFGKPAIEMATATKGEELLFTIGAQSEERLLDLVDMKGKPISKAERKPGDLLEIMERITADGWVAFSIGSFIKEIKLFGFTKVQQWIKDAEGLTGGGGVVFSWGTRERKTPFIQKGSGSEAFFVLRIESEELADLFRLLTSSRGLDLFGVMGRAGDKKTPSPPLDKK